MMARSIFRATITALLALLCAHAHAQDYPSRTVRIVIPFPPGGTSKMTLFGR